MEKESKEGKLVRKKGEREDRGEEYDEEEKGVVVEKERRQESE